MLRKFKSEGDVELAQQLVFDSAGIQKARDLAAHHANLAARAVRSSILLPFCFCPSPFSSVPETGLACR